MKTQNTKIQKHNNIVSVTTTQPPPAPNLAHPQQIQAELPDSDDGERRRAFARESIERKQRADSFYHSLKPEQQDQLLQWLHEDMPLMTILDKVSAPSPEGFGVKVHITSLRRLRSYWRGVDEALRSQELLDTVYDMDRHTDFSQQPRIQGAISQMLHDKAFELARTHPGSEVLGEVLSSITKLAALDHKREKLLLDRQKLLRSVAETPKHHRVDLNIIPPARPATQPPAVQFEVRPQANALQISDQPRPLPAPETPVPAAATAESAADTPADSSPKTPVTRTKIGRNDPCPCGSGHKYKKCCLLKSSLPLVA